MIGQFIVNGFITGVLYSLLAIGFALVYNTTRVFHIAAAGIYVFAANMFWLFAVRLRLPLILAVLVALVLTMGLSLTTEVAVYRPLKRRKASLNVAMIASIGMMTVIVNLVAMFFGDEPKVIPNKTQPSLIIGSLFVIVPQMYQAFFGMGTILAFLLLLYFTKWGIQLRALSVDETLFASLGYNPSTMRTMVFLVSGIFIGAASCLKAYEIGVDNNASLSVFIKAVVAMIIGGVGRFGTCLLGGLVLGVLESVTEFFFPSIWQDVVSFVILIVFLFLRPQGIAGYKKRIV